MKRFVLLLFLISGLFSSRANAQVNLVPNPSFEIYGICPGSYGQISYSLPWFQPNLFYSSSDYFNNCSLTHPYSVPSNNFGYQYARTGNAYAGIITYVNDTAWSNYREYLEIELLDSLKSNKKYGVSFYVSLANSSKFWSNTIGAFFSQNIITYIDPAFSVLNYLPQMQNVYAFTVSDTINWVLITDTIVAQGGEKFITIGNFKDDMNTNFFQNPFGYSNEIYYYIDDVSVILCDSTTGLNDLSNHQNTISIYPNPATTNCTITAPNFINSRLVVYDITGRALLHQGFNAQATIDMRTLTNGVYFVEVKDKEGKRAMGKVVKE